MATLALSAVMAGVSMARLAAMASQAGNGEIGFLAIPLFSQSMFVIIPAVVLAGVWARQPWARWVAIVLFAAMLLQAPLLIAIPRHGFRPALSAGQLAWLGAMSALRAACLWGLGFSDAGRRHFARPPLEA